MAREFLGHGKYKHNPKWSTGAGFQLRGDFIFPSHPKPSRDELHLHWWADYFLPIVIPLGLQPEKNRFLYMCSDISSYISPRPSFTGAELQSQAYEDYPWASASVHTLTSLILCSLFIPSTLAFLSLQLSYTLKVIYIYLPTFLGVSGRTGFRLYWSTIFFVIGKSLYKEMFYN